MSNGASASSMSMQQPCCRIMAVCGMRPCPIYDTKDGYLILSNSGLCRVQSGDRFFMCEKHFGCKASDLVYCPTALKDTVLKIHGVSFKKPESADARSTHPWMSCALAWRPKLQRTLEPSDLLTIRILTSGTDIVPPGIYLCDENNVIIGCCKVGQKSSVENVPNTVLKVFGKGSFNSILVLEDSANKSPDFVSDTLFYAALQYNILMPYSFMCASGKTPYENNNVVLRYRGKIMIWRQYTDKQPSCVEAHRYIQENILQHCFIYESCDGLLEESIFRYLFGSAESVPIPPNPNNFVAQLGEKFFFNEL
ncbi:ORF26-like protein [Bufonid herpesvirus 1]|uniref:ORF26-like protein n=1 Tax=Bufonid herpesvirus 1 TaxID=2282206 RepID=UPI000EB6A9C1|nr:ORF26-like protein [Bufonid herpesvirus 1]AXF48629.1 ORF26-like protein [Bufonid herpesvirus 1]